jgi:hypothetical protein
MQSALETVVQGLRAWTPPPRGGAPGAGHAPDTRRAAALLDRLEGLLKDDDTAGGDLVEQLAVLLPPAAGARLGSLRERAERYDFDGALAALADLRAVLRGSPGPADQ